MTMQDDDFEGVGFGQIDGDVVLLTERGAAVVVNPDHLKGKYETVLADNVNLKKLIVDVVETSIKVWEANLITSHSAMSYTILSSHTNYLRLLPKIAHITIVRPITIKALLLTFITISIIAPLFVNFCCLIQYLFQ